ncbi:hypothetical protein FBZ83_108378 [Azospirillum brasilense]|uniref:Uncharacterized protein n=1 Tax=Azospirillum brasilense TaxID=192 RepID=A0A560C9G3_AZOBR|nr:hypothetical protein [Azospirillum brasilense]TWA81486.1 hypothetical protein FBZ83_108378 [Azospirillum brasilense]
MTMEDQTKTPAVLPKKDDKQDRLAARLRENLRKRKEQARGREKDGQPV